MKSILLCLSLVCIASVLFGYDHATGKPIFLPLKSFDTHYHLIGGTGKGKTTAIEAIQHQLFRARETACHIILDRMGSFSLSLKLWFSSIYCPDHIRDRVVYVEAAREDVVMPFNPLQHTSVGEGYFKVGRATEVILRAWASQNIEEMPRLARWTHNAMWAASQLGLTIADCVHLLMPGSPYHHAILERLPPLLMAEWAEILNARGAEASRILESSRNRMKPFFDEPILRAMFGSTQSRLDMLRFMREKKIVLVNLAPRGRLSPQIADAIGGMIINEGLAVARSLPLGERYPTYYWLDEFQNYVGPDLQSAVPEVRQLGVKIIPSHQAFSQLIKGTTDLSSIIWQAQSRIVFGVQGEDADILANEFASVTYDPEKIKDEVFTRRQLLRDHKVVYLPSWSNSEADAENWSKTYGTNWTTSEGNSNTKGSSHTDATSQSVGRKLGEPLQDRRYTDSRSATDGRSASESQTTTNGQGASEANGEGGSKTHTKSVSMSPAVLPIHEEFLELSRRAYYTFEEQRALWAKEIRNLKTGQALLRLVNDPNIYRVDVKKHTPGYLEWDVEKISRRRPDAIEAMDRMIEQNCASELFVSPQMIERETEERLHRILNSTIVIPALPAPHQEALQLPQLREQENPLI